MATKRLYDFDAYLQDFEAIILECRVCEPKQLLELVLDQTAFFPEQGGQTCDRGVLFIDGNEYEVVEVVSSKEVIVHKLKYVGKVFGEGTKIIGRVNFEHRFSNMQNHTGEHIFTGIAHKKFGCENVGFHLSDNTVTLDLDKKLTAEQIDEIERIANQKIYENHSIKCFFPEDDELSSMEYRCKSEIDGAVRIVEIEDTDTCACCAPHVATTSEVGILVVTGWINYKGGVRVEILCGQRAFDYLRKNLNIIDTVKNMMKCSAEELTEIIPLQSARLKDAEFELNQAKSSLLSVGLENMNSDSQVIMLFDENEYDAKVLRDSVNKYLSTHDGVCAIFTGNDTKGYSFNLGMSPVTDERNCNMFAAEFREKLQGKCGGTKEMITGRISSSREEIEALVKSTGG